MKVYMTIGTVHFLLTLIEKHPTINFHIMNSNSGALAYYENHTKNIFSAGRAYEAIATRGTIQKKGFVVINNIPVVDEGRPLFEDRFKQRQEDIGIAPGFQAFRLLKPLKGNTYVIFTQWASEQDFENWKNSGNFQQAHKEIGTKPSAYFADRPFATNYLMLEMDEV